MAVTLWLLREACLPACPSARSQMKTAGKVNAVAERETECGVRARKAAAAAAGSQSYYDAQKSSLTVWFLLPVRARCPLIPLTVGALTTKFRVNQEGNGPKDVRYARAMKTWLLSNLTSHWKLKYVAFKYLLICLRVNSALQQPQRSNPTLA